MSKLSLSRAWEETRSILARDGRLFGTVALALIAVPAAITGLINPTGMTDTSKPLWTSVLGLVAGLIAIVGQLALIRLALVPREAVGAAIAHGARRMPAYLLALLILVVVLLACAIPFGLALMAAGVPLETTADTPIYPSVVLAILLYLALLFFIGVRLLLAGPVASAEDAGAIAIIRRSWELTKGHWWRLFAFLLLFFIGAVVAVIAIGAAVGILSSLALGPIEPMSASALVLALVQALFNAVVTTLFTVMLARIYVQLTAGADVQASVPSSGT